MSLSITPLVKGKQPTVQAAIAYQVTVLDYVPPFQYDLLFEWRLSSNGEQYNIIQNYSLQTVVCFTTLKPGSYHLKCSARLGKQRLYQKIPYLPKQSIHELDIKNVLFEHTIQLKIHNISSQQPPCCIPLQGCTSPLYLVPSTKYVDDMQVRILFKLQERQKSKEQKVKLDEPIAPTKIDFTKVRKQKITFVNNQIQVTGWHHIFPNQNAVDGESGELYMQLLGMVGGEIYQTKHQVICDGKKLELKNMVSYQATELQGNAQLQVIYASELREKPYLIITDGHSSQQLFPTSTDQKKGLQHESILMNAYGHYFLRYNDASDKSQEQPTFLHQKRRIMITNGAQVVCLCAGPCDFIRPWAYTSVEIPQSVRQISQGIIKTLEQQNLTFQNQTICISTLGGVPLRSISIGYVNHQLRQFWEDRWAQYVQEQTENGVNITEKLKQLMSYQEIQKLPQYRPLVRLNTFVPLPTGNYLITGQAEVMLIDYPEIYTIVADYIAKFGSKQYKAINLGITSILTAAVIIVQADGKIVDYLYVTDILPTLMNSVELIELYLNSEKGNGNVPGFLSQSGYAVNYSYIDHVDVTSQDCFCVLPRQGAILRIDPDNLKRQKEQLNGENISMDRHVSTLSLEEAKQDLILYCSAGACSSLSLLAQKTIQPNMHPLGISRVGPHTFLLVSNELCNSVDVLVLRSPQWIGRGRNFATSLEKNESCTSFEELGEAEGDLQRSSLSASGRDSGDYIATDGSESEQLDEFVLLERVIVAEGTAPKAGAILGLQHRNFVVALQYEKTWRVIEIRNGTCVHAGIVSGAESLRFIRMP